MNLGSGKNDLDIHIIKDFGLKRVDQSGSSYRCLYLYCIWLWQKIIVEEIYMLKWLVICINCSRQLPAVKLFYIAAILIITLSKTYEHQ